MERDQTVGSRNLASPRSNNSRLNPLLTCSCDPALVSASCSSTQGPALRPVAPQLELFRGTKGSADVQGQNTAVTAHVALRGRVRVVRRPASTVRGAVSVPQGLASGDVTGGGAASGDVTGGGAASGDVPGGGAASGDVTGGGAATRSRGSSTPLFARSVLVYPNTLAASSSRSLAFVPWSAVTYERRRMLRRRGRVCTGALRLGRGTSARSGRSTRRVYTGTRVDEAASERVRV